ncbi:unnamed protein product [Sphagnum jensenii]
MSGSTSGKRISTSRWKKWSSSSNISRNIIQLKWKRAGTAAMIVIDNQRAEALKYDRSQTRSQIKFSQFCPQAQ